MNQRYQKMWWRAEDGSSFWLATLARPTVRRREFFQIAARFLRKLNRRLDTRPGGRGPLEILPEGGW